MFVVAKVASAPSGNTPSQGFVNLLEYAGGGRVAIGADKSGALRGVVSDDGNAAQAILPAGGAPVGAFHLYELVVDAGSAGASVASELARDGTSIATGSVKAPPNGLRDWNWLGWWKADGVAGCYLNGAIGEVVIVARALAGTERADVEKYLRTRWSL